KPAPGLEPSSLAAQQTLAGARLDAATWPADQWWRGYGDAQLDALIAEALAGSPSLEIAAARLRSAQAQAIAAGAVQVPAASLDAETTRQRYPEHGLFPPPFAGSYSTDARVALDFSFDLDFWGRNRALLAAAGPDRGQRLRRPQLAAPADLALPAALPADLLARRPDVAAARAQVQAAAHGVAAAEADFYPNVNLTAFAGLQSIGLSQLLQ